MRVPTNLEPARLVARPALRLPILESQRLRVRVAPLEPTNRELGRPVVLFVEWVLIPG